uniref:Uncharacterized protein n=1 Tax=Chlamydomonas euryale TaxID=1486919 RepID=A0A7R9YUC4_9CHLO|mmetsp:Transcript_26580/g.78957  ORF Transcript_26580/g.78957 Transcript_26580/m.78957 type:complete len:124 (+) Transcript_26580:2009-2380(+)
MTGAWVAPAAPAELAEMERVVSDALPWYMEAVVERAVAGGLEVAEAVEEEAAEDSWAHVVEATRKRSRWGRRRWRWERRGLRGGGSGKLMRSLQGQSPRHVGPSLPVKYFVWKDGVLVKNDDD